MDPNMMHQHPISSACLQKIMQKMTHSLVVLPALLSFSQMLALQLMKVSSKMRHSCEAVVPKRTKHSLRANHIPKHSLRDSYRARANSPFSPRLSPRHSPTAIGGPNCNPWTSTRRNQAILLST